MDHGQLLNNTGWLMDGTKRLLSERPLDEGLFDFSFLLDVL